MIVMRSKREPQSLMDDDAYRELRLLTEVDKTSESTQRDLSKRVGIALGITNVLLRNLSQKGYIRVTQAGWKRWLYALTPAGLSRKIQLTAAYVHRVLDHYQKVRQTLREELEPLDLLHIWHIRHLKEARRLGDLLVVTLTADQYVNKEPGRPLLPSYS